MLEQVQAIASLAFFALTCVRLCPQSLHWRNTEPSILTRAHPSYQSPSVPYQTPAWPLAIPQSRIDLTLLYNLAEPAHTGSRAQTTKYL